MAYHHSANYRQSIEEEAERHGRRLISLIKTLHFPPSKIPPEKSIDTKEGWNAQNARRRKAMEEVYKYDLMPTF